MYDFAWSTCWDGGYLGDGEFSGWTTDDTNKCVNPFHNHGKGDSEVDQLS